MKSGTRAPSRGLAVASVVLAVASFPLVLLNGLGLITGLVALVSSVVALALAGIVPDHYRGRGMAAWGLGLSLLFWYGVTTLAIPDILGRPTGSMNENGAIGDTRGLQSAEVAYSSSNNGVYGSLSCLAAPASCGFAAGTTPFIDSQLASLRTKQGYIRSFVPGTSAAGSPDAHGIRTFAYVSIPAKALETGTRGFCGDDTGVICFTTDGTAPPVQDGRCRADCTKLR